MLTVLAVGQTKWWFIGIGIGFTIVLVVVIVAMTILALAGRIGQQTRDGVELMEEAGGLTQPIWEVQRTNALLTVIWKAAEAARESLEQNRREDVR